MPLSYSKAPVKLGFLLLVQAENVTSFLLSNECPQVCCFKFCKQPSTADGMHCLAKAPLTMEPSFRSRNVEMDSQGVVSQLMDTSLGHAH